MHNLGLLESHGVDYTVFQLDGPAKQWWRAYVATRPPQSPPMTWIAFFEAFMAKFIPHSDWKRMREEFTRLRQGSMTVTEYET